MRIWSPNSRRCSTPKLALALALAASLGPLGAAQAAVGKAAPSAGLETRLRAGLAGRRPGASFENLLKQWEREHGSRAVGPLLTIASDRKLEDSGRFVALMAAARLGGAPAAPLIAPLLKDRSWMVRSGALRALGALGNPSTALSVLPLLSDPALVVRSEAVDAVRVLRPVGGVEALLDAIESPANYHHGKAQWVPQKALSSLPALKGMAAYQPEAIALRLKPLLPRHGEDPVLVEKTIETLERLTGKALKRGAPLAERAAVWGLELSRR